ncbi:biosynthetic-type acetolactate synthase large subunit [Streptomyces sp. TRM76323]|uniref:Acetolactate synthase n=1 Tax=Streptomyces tamarix TaxID=3078565 RepID=A0ABU3QV99_9ACTN|nr:biosynthetic-type acetolactate synthase large subunit [Streptomyces tamarix]MDT9686486.1 biosynthetic-type acetolactate synthase large subunit [Streptomyces tamarix]
MATDEERHVTGAAAALHALRNADVRVVFGIPGRAIVPLYHTLGDFPEIRHILTRHEQGAGHAASGYAQATGRLGVCLSTSGPGATNLVTALMDAQKDSVPVLAITGQVESDQLGTGAFQEADICSVVSSVTKYSVEVTRAEDVFPAVTEAARRAMSGRPGAVLVSITLDAFNGRAPAPGDGPKAADPPAPEPARIEQAVAALLAARRPVLYAGGGVVRGEAAGPLRELAEEIGVPVLTTLMARGAFPDGHRLGFGMPGMYGTIAATAAMQNADLILAVGARFDSRVTGKLDAFAPDARVVHIDIDDGEISRRRRADIAVTAHCRPALTMMRDRVREALGSGRHRHPDLSSWWDTLDGWRSRHEPGHGEEVDGALDPRYAVERLGALTAGPNTLYTAGVGQHQVWAAKHIRYERPRTFITTCGAGTMGYAVPAAMGVQAAHPDAQVWAIDGDGSFQMMCQELATCVQARLPIKVAVINNAMLGMVRQWQDLWYSHDDEETDLSDHKENQSPDISALARAYGCAAFTCADPGEVDRVVTRASAVRDRPVVVEFLVSQSARSYPLAPPHAPVPDLLPDFDGID